MLWRPGYQPIVREEVALPPFEASLLDGGSAGLPKILIGGFHVQSLLEQDIWRRLVVESGLEAEALQVVFGGDPRLVEAMVPKSRRASVAVSPESKAWRDLIQPDPVSRAFAVLIKDGVGRLLVVGPPTEDVWEQFELACRD